MKTDLLNLERLCLTLAGCLTLSLVTHAQDAPPPGPGSQGGFGPGGFGGPGGMMQQETKVVK